MVDTRIAPRPRVDKPAIAESGGDNQCTVRDLSASRLAIEFPDRVNLKPIAKPSHRSCQRMACGFRAALSGREMIGCE
jgi:hypothetical protein